jgi:hypothetical protein
MKKNTILLIRVKKEIEAELEGIQKLKQEFTALPEGNPAYLLRAKGSIFHDFYSAAERVFTKIGEELNGGIPKSEQWHKELLFDMTLDLETVRPPVISVELQNKLTIFLRFRHLFRNMYGYELKAEKISELENLLIPTAEQFISEIKGFCAWLSEQADII